MRDNKFATKDGFVNIISFGETNRIAYKNQIKFDSYGCPPLKL